MPCSGVSKMCGSGVVRWGMTTPRLRVFTDKRSDFSLTGSETTNTDLYNAVSDRADERPRSVCVRRTVWEPVGSVMGWWGLVDGHATRPRV